MIVNDADPCIEATHFAVEIDLPPLSPHRFNHHLSISVSKGDFVMGHLSHCIEISLQFFM